VLVVVFPSGVMIVLVSVLVAVFPPGVVIVSVLDVYDTPPQPTG
jgi:hypothetical protein